MSTVSERPRGATTPAPFDPTDPGALQRWLADVREQADDAICAGLDATAPLRRRVLSRAEARRKLLAARRALRALFAAAAAAGGDHG